jgi:hypothetical protein
MLIRRAIYYAGAFALLLPLLPFYLLKVLCETTAEFLDWLFEGRAIPVFLSRQVDRLEAWSYRTRLHH